MMSNAAAPATEGPDRTTVPCMWRSSWTATGAGPPRAGLPRAEGHRRGVEALRRVVRAAHELGMLYLTIFSFSSENWSRPATEIGDLFGLLRRFIRNDLATLHRDGVRVRVIGERDGTGAGHLRAAQRSRRTDQGQHQAQSRRRVQLRIAAGNRQCGATAGARSRRGQARSRVDRCRHARPISRCARYSRSRSDHSHQRRAAAVEFPDVAGGLQRTRVRADPLAGFRQGRARRARSPNMPDGSAVSAVWPRKPDRDRGQGRAGGRCRAGFAQSPDARSSPPLVLVPLAIAIAYAGGWLWTALVTLAAIGLYVEWLMVVGARAEQARGRVGRCRACRRRVLSRDRADRCCARWCLALGLVAVALIVAGAAQLDRGGISLCGGGRDRLGAGASRSPSRDSPR